MAYPGAAYELVPLLLATLLLLPTLLAAVIGVGDIGVASVSERSDMLFRNL